MKPSEVEGAVATTVARFRTVGAVFLIVGTFSLLFGLLLAFEPAVPFTINGVRTTDTSAKLKVVAFASIHTCVGAVLCLIPKRRLAAFWRGTYTAFARER